MQSNASNEADAVRAKAVIAVESTAAADVEAELERLSLIVDETGVGTWDWNPVEDVASWNARAYEMFGLRKEEVPASFRSVAERIHPDDLPAVRHGLFKHLEKNGRFSLDLRARQSDGEYRWVHCCGRALRGPDGRATRVVGLLIDIDERKRAEERALQRSVSLAGTVTERTKELELARQELEEFCYAVSHDLRTPLRSINGFSRALETEYSSRLDEIGIDYLKRIQRASMTLSELLDSLLSMVRLSRVEMHSETINITQLVYEVASEFAEVNPERSVSLEVEPGLEVRGDPRMIRLMMANLLSNAWKFTANEADARIEVGRSESVFFVRDNGAGFDMRYSDKLYKPFQKLHSTARFPGSGIGLTIAQRIVARHGGSLWADSKEGSGATFYFTLP